MKTRSFLSLGFASLCAVLLVSSRVADASSSPTAVSGQTTPHSAPAATPDANAPVNPKQPSAPQRYGWPQESSWLTVPPLPEVRYAVVPLAALGLPLGSSVEALDDLGGVLAWAWDDTAGAWREKYLAPGGALLDVPLNILTDAAAYFDYHYGYTGGPSVRSLYRGDLINGNSGDWPTALRRLGSTGQVVGWQQLPSGGLDAAVWNPANETILAVPPDTSVTGGGHLAAETLGINASGQVIVWQHGVLNTTPAGSQFPWASFSGHEEGRLLDVSIGTGNLLGGGRLAWETGEMLPDSYFFSLPLAGTSVQPVGLNDGGTVVGYRHPPSLEDTDWLRRGQAVIVAPGGQVQALAPSAPTAWWSSYFLALTNGTVDGVLPVAIGREADVPENFDWAAAGVEGGPTWSGYRLWWAHPVAGVGGTVTWQKEPLRAFVPSAVGPPSKVQRRRGKFTRAQIAELPSKKITPPAFSVTSG